LKIYVATKFEQAAYAKKVMEALESAGHSITHDWTGEVSEGKEEDELKQFLLKCASADFEGVRNCDLLLLLNHQHGKGMFTELGMALAFNKKVIVIDGWKANNIFFSLPNCTMVKTVGEAIDLIQTIGKET
jgi:hypothetical protein